MKAAAWASTVEAPRCSSTLVGRCVENLRIDRVHSNVDDARVAVDIEGFIPAKIAIVLKNEWHDTIFCKAILANIASDLRDRDVISLGLYENLYSKITSQEDQQNTLYILYAIMRFKEGSDVYKLDDLIKIPKKKLVVLD